MVDYSKNEIKFHLLDKYWKSASEWLGVKTNSRDSKLENGAFCYVCKPDFDEVHWNSTFLMFI